MTMRSLRGRPLWNAVALGGLTGGWSSLSLVLMPFGPQRVTGWAAQRWGRSVLAACGVEVVARGLDQALDRPAYLVMANHSSHFDVPALYATLPMSLKALAKKELAYVPVFGWMLALGGAVMIDRKSKTSAIASVERAGALVRAGQTVLLFPEGTRTPSGVLGPLKKGPFHLASSARVPILPVGISGSAEVLAKGDWRIRPGVIRIHVGRPIETAHRPPTDDAREALALEVREALLRLMAWECDAGGESAMSVDSRRPGP